MVDPGWDLLGFATQAKGLTGGNIQFRTMPTGRTDLQTSSDGVAVQVDPALVQELVSARRRNDPLAALSARESEVLTVMAEGLSNAGIARRLFVTEGTVEKHVRSILTKLDLPETGDDHRRVRAVIMYLESR